MVNKALGSVVLQLLLKLEPNLEQSLTQNDQLVGVSSRAVGVDPDAVLKKQKRCLQNLRGVGAANNSSVLVVRAVLRKSR